jgi:uncharacterized protein (TIGR03437 family)
VGKIVNLRRIVNPPAAGYQTHKPTVVASASPGTLIDYIHAPIYVLARNAVFHAEERKGGIETVTEILQSAFSEGSAARRAAGRQGSGVMRAIGARLLLGAAALVICTGPSGAQTSILNTNLIVNGNAEAGPAGSGVVTAVASIPGWTVQSGKPTVLPYNFTSTAAQQPTNGYPQLTDPAPPDHGFQYFAAAFPSLPSVMSQVINVSSASSLINAGNAEFIASAYMGSAGGVSTGTQMAVAFQNGSGQTFSTTTVGPLMFPFAGGDVGMFFQQQIGLVPVGTVQITVSLTLQDGNYDTGVADSLSLKLTQAGSSPALGTNLVVNPGAELGPNAALPAAALYVPGWSTNQIAGSVAPYGGTGFISTQSPGPADRGTSLFCGWVDTADLYQDIDVSAAATAIDSGQVTYVVSGWLGGSSGASAASLTYLFFDWTGKQLAPSAQLTSGSFAGYSLIETEHTGILPSGTRRVRIDVSFPSSDSLADDIGFTLSAPAAPPVLTPGGIVSASAFGGFPTIAPGSWIEIYGDNLFPQSPQQWALSQFTNGVAPTSLGGVSVSVGGAAAAFVDFVSASQVNALVPSTAPIGPTFITLTNANGASDDYPIYVNATQPGILAPPTFTVNGKQYVGALFSDGQTFALPLNAIPGVPSRPAQPGDVLTIYGVGFGPVTGGFTAGTIVTAANSLVTPVQFSFGSTQATLNYSGLAPSFTGLYQFNVVVPAGLTANSAEPISFSQSGVKSTQTLYIAIQ